MDELPNSHSLISGPITAEHGNVHQFLKHIFFSFFVLFKPLKYANEQWNNNWMLIFCVYPGWRLRMCVCFWRVCVSQLST